MAVSKWHFEASDQSYGIRRLLVELNNKGIRIGRYRVRSLMKEIQLISGKGCRQIHNN